MGDAFRHWFWFEGRWNSGTRTSPKAIWGAALILWEICFPAKENWVGGWAMSIVSWYHWMYELHNIVIGSAFMFICSKVATGRCILDVARRLRVVSSAIDKVGFLLRFCFICFVERNRLGEWSIHRMIPLLGPVRFICSSLSAYSAAAAWLWRQPRLMAIIL